MRKICIKFLLIEGTKFHHLQDLKFFKILCLRTESTYLLKKAKESQVTADREKRGKR